MCMTNIAAALASSFLACLRPRLVEAGHCCRSAVAALPHGQSPHQSVVPHRPPVGPLTNEVRIDVSRVEEVCE